MSISGRFSTFDPMIFFLNDEHVGVGKEAGEVRFKIHSDNGTIISTIRIFCAFFLQGNKEV